MSDENDTSVCCVICGAEMEWIDCACCGGDGEIDCYEDDPLWYDPGDTEPCPECHGAGGWLECPNLPHAKEKKEGDATGGADEVRADAGGWERKSQEVSDE